MASDDFTDTEPGVPGLVGKSLGPYEVRSKIGEGGMGAVYLAYDNTLEREVALKVLPPEFARDQQYVQRFEREAKSLARLRHPNLVHIYTVGHEDRIHYFAMEFIKGETLADYMKKRGPLPEDEVLNLGAQILAALHAIHHLGITHRDIKAANIMIDGPGHAVLMDFGLAKDRGDESGLTTVGAVLGTPEYMAPEQAQGEEVSPSTDIYSFGVLLYEMLAGRLPFLGNSVMATLRAHIDEPPPPLPKIRPGVSKELVRVVHKALGKTSAERYSSAAHMARDLYEIHPVQELREIAGEARDAKTLPLKPVHGKQRLQAATVAVGVVVLLTAVLVVASALFKRGSKPLPDNAVGGTVEASGDGGETTVKPPAPTADIVSARVRLRSGREIEGKVIGIRRHPPDEAFLIVETPAGDERSLPLSEVDVIQYGE